MGKVFLEDLLVESALRNEGGRVCWRSSVSGGC